MKTPYDVRRIMNFLPHRYPFLLVDRVIDLVPGEKVTALKNVTINEPFFQGHFPEIPVMPGVLIIEAMAQAGGVLVMESLPEDMRGGVIYFMGIDKARFRKPVVPGDQILFEVTKIKQRLKAVRMEGIASVDGSVVAEAQLMATIGDKA